MRDSKVSLPVRQVVTGLGLFALCATLAMSAKTSTADAYTTSPFCGGWRAPFSTAGSYCWGAVRKMFGVAGTGDHGRVCVWISLGGHGGVWENTNNCSSGAGVWAYGAVNESKVLEPAIRNMMPNNNFVHGKVFSP